MARRDNKILTKCGSCCYLDNYRGITLTPNVYELYCKVIEDNLMDHIEIQNILGEEQTYGKQPVYTSGLCSIQKSNKKKTFWIFGLSKAFDRVWTTGLFYLLWKNGKNGK